MTTLQMALGSLPKPNRQQRVGQIITLMGLLLLNAQVLQWAQTHLPAPTWRALEGGLLGLIAGGVGALPALALRRAPHAVSGLLMAAGAGMMISAVVLALWLPGAQLAQDAGHSPLAALLQMAIGTAVGGLCLARLSRMGAARTASGQGAAHATEHKVRTSQVQLFIVAIAAHNIPEGVIVGWTLSADTAQAHSLAAAIAAQNAAEGLVMALTLIAAGLSRRDTLAVTLLTGLVEPVAGVLASLLSRSLLPLLPWGMALAAGAMLYAAGREVIPSALRRQRPRWVVAGIAAGLLAMGSMTQMVG